MLIRSAVTRERTQGIDALSFTASFETYGGNSGGPVFSEYAGELIYEGVVNTERFVQSSYDGCRIRPDVATTGISRAAGFWEMIEPIIAPFNAPGATEQREEGRARTNQ